MKYITYLLQCGLIFRVAIYNKIYCLYIMRKIPKEALRSLLLEINLLHKRKYIIIHLILSLL